MAVPLPSILMDLLIKEMPTDNGLMSLQIMAQAIPNCIQVATTEHPHK